MTRSLVLSACLLSLTVWAYRSVWSADWVYEDRAAMTSAASVPHLWSPRGLSSATWAWTSTPRAAHLFSLVSHLLIGGLVGLLAWHLGVSPFGAWVAAMLWLLLPITVETAAYAKARADQLVLIGTLLACLAAAGRWWRPLSLAGVLAGLLVALGAKQAGVVALGLVPLTIWHGRASARPQWAAWWGPAVLASLLVVAGVLWYGGPRALVNADSEAGVSLAGDVTALQWLSAQCGAFWYWLVATVWPSLLTPDADVDRLSGLARAMGGYVLLVAAGACWKFRRQAPVVSVACGWIVLGVLPRLLIQTPRSYLNAAQVAISLVGLVVLAGLAADRLKALWGGIPST